MSFIKKRTDVSEWLIHFVRDRDPTTDFPDEESRKRCGAGLSLDASAYEVLHSIIDTGGLIPGYSFRGGKTTIYGGTPAVCFTEAPIYDFFNYVEERANVYRCSHYGFCFLKREVFAAGGRPVIYGLAAEEILLTEDLPTRRIMAPSTLPLTEQFRYVAYNPNRLVPLDWTHEREWRWIPNDEQLHQVWYDGPRGIGNNPALPLFKSMEMGGHFTKIGVIVRTRDEAQVVAEKLLAYADSKRNQYSTPFCPTILRNSFVVPLEEIKNQDRRRIEDLESDLRVQANRASANDDLLLKVQFAVKEANARAIEVADALLKSAPRDADGFIRAPCGWAWVATEASSSQVLDAMLKSGLAEAMGDYYRVHVLDGVETEDLLFVASAAALAAADTLNAKLEDIFGYVPFVD